MGRAQAGGPLPSQAGAEAASPRGSPHPPVTLTGRMGAGSRRCLPAPMGGGSSAGCQHRRAPVLGVSSQPTPADGEKMCWVLGHRGPREKG